MRRALFMASLSCLMGASVAAQQQRPQLPARADTVPTAPPSDSGYVIYDDGPISWPLGIGLRLPAYTRVDGLVLPWGPFISLADERLEVDATLTYRSHLGAIDPFATAHWRIGERSEIEVAGGRATLTNDAWIRSDVVNSAAVLFLGSDARNYYRADRFAARLSHEFGTPGFTLTPRVGAVLEDAWSTGANPMRRPWSVLGRTGEWKMRRPNPEIARGRINSGIAGATFRYARGGVTFDGVADAERAFDSPVMQLGGSLVATETFTQFTSGFTVTFRTFAEQRLTSRARLVFTPDGLAPPQRYAYLGGGGTLATVEQLSMGGDHLLFADGTYTIPIPRFELGFLGHPFISVRYAAGAAGIREIPELVQNLSFGAGVGPLKLEYHIDPDFVEAPNRRRNAFSLGVSLTL